MTDNPFVNVVTYTSAPGYTNLSINYTFTDYVFWQPQITGVTTFPVPLASWGWYLSDSAALAQGAWTASGSIGPGAAPRLTSAYPLWNSVVVAGNPPQTTFQCTNGQ